jgi:hypothetical protein
MTAELLEDFEDIRDEFYPGSRQRLRAFATHTSKAVTLDEMKPRAYSVGGKQVEFFTIGQLAKALGREPVTIRKWEREGILPRSPYAAPSEDPRGRRRLYTREMIQGIVNIAQEENMFEISRRVPIRRTNFTARVVDLFRQLLERGV